jgi:predicted Rossmann-fold nucleotide-binding protein
MSATTDITTNSKYVMKSVCVFCGSKTGNRPEYVEGTKALAKEMLKRQIGLVYGGGNIGLMGVVSSSIVEGT